MILTRFWDNPHNSCVYSIQQNDKKEDTEICFNHSSNSQLVRYGLGK